MSQRLENVRMDEKQLYLGVSREDITPTIGGKLYGYNDTTFSDSLHDNLTATAFVFQSNDLKTVLVTATVCLIQNELAEHIRREIADNLSIPVGNCILCATHTHSGPNTAAEPGFDSLDEEYCDHIFVPGIIKAVKDAASNLQVVRVGIASGNSYVGINRRQLLSNNTIGLGQNPWGPFDPKMTVLSFKNMAGDVVANIIHYGAHGTASGLNTEITRDWPGIMTDRLEQLTGGITAFFNGPEGDVGPRLTNGGTMGNIQYMEELGGIAASDACRIYRDIRSWSEAKLLCFQGNIKIPLRARRSMEYLEKELEAFRSGFANVNGAGTRKEYLEKVLASYESDYTEQEYKEIQQSIVCIGEAAFISFPYELFSVIGMRIAEADTIPYALSLSNANGCEGYFVTEDQICRGGYEVDLFFSAGVQEYVRNADWYVVKDTVKNLEACISGACFFEQT